MGRYRPDRPPRSDQFDDVAVGVPHEDLFDFPPERERLDVHLLELAQSCGVILDLEGEVGRDG